MRIIVEMSRNAEFKDSVLTEPMDVSDREVAATVAAFQLAGFHAHHHAPPGYGLRLLLDTASNLALPNSGWWSTLVRISVAPAQSTT